MADAPVAHTSLGDLRGVFRDGIAAFHGVPYAEPPNGELRFAPPHPCSPGAGCAMRRATVRSRHSRHRA